MEIKFSKKRVSFEKELSSLDKLVFRFVKALDASKIDYVIISGYVAILFGRSRATEDVDLFIEEMPFEKFLAFWNDLEKAGFECIITSNPKEAFDDYLQSKLAIRFAEKGTFIPNFELKFPKTRHNHYSLEHKIEVLLNNQRLMTSELELQIAFKLKLGSDKDFEDARHLFKVFDQHLNKQELNKHITELGVEKQAEKILWQKQH